MEPLEIRGSEVGMCPRYLSIKALGGELESPPGWLQKIFDGGHDQEEEAVVWLEEEYGEPVSGRQREVTAMFKNVDAVGHIDGIQDDRLVEIKALGEQKRSLIEQGGLAALPQYLFQVVTYLYGLQYEEEDGDVFAEVPNGLRFVVKHWEQDEYTVLDFSLSDLKEQMERVADVLDSKLESIRQAVEQGEPLPIPSDLDDYNCATCPARYHCYENLLEQSIVLSSSEQDVSQIAAYQFYQQMDRVAKNIKLRVQEHFAARLAEEEAKKISTTMGSATLVKSMRSKFDKRKAKGFLSGEQFDECETKTPSESIRITVRDENTNET